MAASRRGRKPKVGSGREEERGQRGREGGAGAPAPRAEAPAPRPEVPTPRPEVIARAGDDSAERLLRTGEVLEATGITHQVLYRYVTLGLIEEAQETAGGQRLFHPRVIPLILHVKGLNETGYSLRDIKDIFFKQRRVRRACR